MNFLVCGCFGSASYASGFAGYYTVLCYRSSAKHCAFLWRIGGVTAFLALVWVDDHKAVTSKLFTSYSCMNRKTRCSIKINIHKVIPMRETRITTTFLHPKQSLVSPCA